MATGRLLLAVEVDAATETVRFLTETVAAAEQAGFAFVTFGDGPVPPASGARIEAGTRAAYLSQLTRRIGLAPTLHVTTTEPFHLATQLASLDHASHGRAAWVVGAANDAPARATIGESPLSEDARTQEIRDVIDVARALWDSWEDDAVIRDVATGRFLDNDKVHHVRFEGASFGIVGPLITPRPPQGQVVVIAAEELGVADRADITLVGGLSESTGQGALAQRVRTARTAGSPLVFADLEVALSGATDAFTERLAGLAAHVDGVLFRPADIAADFPVLVNDVLPRLAERGLVRTPGSDNRTLRDVLGLPRPANRFAAASAAAITEAGATNAAVTTPVRSTASA
jgi:alkanesulfonate monooxygenase SsuD/methylene tetrahydromethanopterin reductase-like flavin-dependent oxidoreductase (luciferase family)